jgi:hypothetical protein
MGFRRRLARLDQRIGVEKRLDLRLIVAAEDHDAHAVPGFPQRTGEREDAFLPSLDQVGQVFSSVYFAPLLKKTRRYFASLNGSSAFPKEFSKVYHCAASTLR